MRLVLAAALALGCGAPSDTVVLEGVRLAPADGVIAAPGAPLMVVRADRADPVPAGTGPVRIAIDREVAWASASAALEQLRAAGRDPIVLVGRRGKLHAMAVDPPGGAAHAMSTIRVIATIDGKACVSPPGVEEAKCVQSYDRVHIDRAFTRELVREAVREYQLERAVVLADEAMLWVDVVRAFDGTRTCCRGVDVETSLGTNR